MGKISESEKAEQIAKECRTSWSEELVDGYDGESEWIDRDDFKECYKSAKRMGEWQKKALIDKAVKFLRPKISSLYLGDESETEKFINEFKKIMEDKFYDKE